MNVEIELRYVLKGEKLKKVSEFFSDVKSKWTKDTYYVTDKPSEYLRIREEDGKKSLEFHDHVAENTTHEWETDISDPEIAKQILERIGKKVDIVVEKERFVKDFDGCLLMLDKVKDLGDFLEIEADNVGQAERCAEKLDLKGIDRGEDKSYPNLLKENLARMKNN